MGAVDYDSPEALFALMLTLPAQVVVGHTPPVIEEEEPQGSPQRSQKSGEEAGKTSPVRQSRDDTFEGLSDLFVTSQEIFKDDPITAGVSSSIVEATSILQQPPSTQELTLTITPTTTPQLKSVS